MNKASKRHMAENEVVFRKLNERIEHDMQEHQQIAAEEGQTPLHLDGTSSLFFYCECSDENCRERIQLSPDEYKTAHQAGDTFTVVCGHEVSSIESVLFEEPGRYCVVKKFQPPPKSADQLRPTPTDNT